MTEHLRSMTEVEQRESGLITMPEVRNAGIQAIVVLAPGRSLEASIKTIGLVSLYLPRADYVGR